MLASNTLYYGDNLPRLRALPDESVDLIYLDPPFNSSRNFNLLFKQQKGDTSPAQIMAFADTWKWSNELYEEFRCDARNTNLYDFMDCMVRMLGKSEMMAYLLMMGPRLMEMQRILKPTGSFYLHCDPAASHYLKLILDIVFRPQNFKNEIIWKRADAHNDPNRYGAIHDSILFYVKSDKFAWNRTYTPYSEAYLTSKWNTTPSGRMYKCDDMTDPQKSMAEYDFQGTTARWRTGREKMLELWDSEQTDVPNSHGRIKLTKVGSPRMDCRITFLEERKGVPMQDIWADIKSLRGGAAERRGYPTQKPLALLERIIAASSNEGDVVLDPFCGCGTAVIQSARMKRRWIGIDITYLAIAEIMYRLDSETDAKLGEDYEIRGIPTDDNSARAFFAATAKQNHKPFEMWAVSLTGAHPIEKKGGDRGIDGRLPIYDPDGALRWAMVQVKGGSLTVSQIRDCAHVVSREKAVFGMFVSLEEPTRQMRQEAEELGFLEGYGSKKIPRLQLRTLREILEDKHDFDIPMGYQPMRDQGVGRTKIVQTEMPL
jgi:site-specific DNA-methyltransferase (adenine-specific)